MKKICRLAMVLGTVAVFGFLGCTALTGNNKSGTTQSGTEGNTGGNENGNNTGENNQNQTVDLSTLLSSLTEDETATLEESINTQILSSANGLTGITASIDADKKLTLTYGGNASVAITPVLTDDGAIKLLETYANKSTVIASKKTELKNTADNFAIPNELAQKLAGNAADLKASVKLLIENIPPEKFAYDLGSRAIYLKMSDLDSSDLPEATEDGATVIPGVKRIKKNGRIALDFTELANADIKLDFENKTDIVLKNKYQGGLLLPTKNVSLIGTEGAQFKAIVDIEDFKEKTSSSIFDYISSLDDEKLPFLTFLNPVKTDEYKNIYGTSIDTLVSKYYSKNDKVDLTGKTGTGISLSAREYDAKEALDETSSKRMFDDDNTVNSSAHKIDTGFAAYLLDKGVVVKNVVIGDVGENWPSDKGLVGTLANSAVNTNMDNKDALYVQGIVRFNGKTPKNFATNDSEDVLTKVIIGEFNTETEYKTGRYDITALNPTDQKTVVNKGAKGYYYLKDKNGSNNKNDLLLSEGQVFIFPSENYYRTNATTAVEYPNSDFEEYGNSGEKANMLNGVKLEKGSGTIPSNSLQARANNIKLTPIQKLLLDDQHIYG